MTKKMRLSQILFSQGFGTRRQCSSLIYNEEVKVAGEVVDDGDAEFDPVGLTIEVSGKPWPFYEKALVLLNKPSGYECSQKPKHHPSVLSLLPPPLRERGVQPVYVYTQVGPDHDRTFHVEVRVADEVLARATGRSRKEAASRAAEAALAPGSSR